VSNALDLAIIIVSWNCSDALADCLRSLADGAREADDMLSYETAVVDNRSADDTVERLRREFPDVRIIANDKNVGFAAANNQGIEATTGRHVLLLNPDTIVAPGALVTLVRALEADATIGCLGPMLLNADGSLQPSVRQLPTVAAFCHRYTPLRMLKVCKGAYARYKMRDFDYDRAADAPSLVGAAMCMPRRILQQVGLMDERFFLYFEETDLCRRIAEAGHRVCYTPVAQITHIGNVSGIQSTPALLYRRSMLKYVAKYGGGCGGMKAFGLLVGMFVQELMQLTFCVPVSGLMFLFGQWRPAAKKWRRAAYAARFLFRDGWQMLTGK